MRGALDSPVPRLVALDPVGHPAQFAHDLETLDRVSARTHDTIHAYYVRTGQTDAADILANSAQPAAALNPLFLELLASLGWPVSVASHPGWTGEPATSWKVGRSN